MCRLPYHQLSSRQLVRAEDGGEITGADITSTVFSAHCFEAFLLLCRSIASCLQTVGQSLSRGWSRAFLVLTSDSCKPFALRFSLLSAPLEHARLQVLAGAGETLVVNREGAKFLVLMTDSLALPQTTVPSACSQLLLAGRCRRRARNRTAARARRQQPAPEASA